MFEDSCSDRRHEIFEQRASSRSNLFEILCIPPFTMPGKKQAVFFTTLQAWCCPLLTDVIESSQKKISYPFAPLSQSSPHNSGV